MGTNSNRSRIRCKHDGCKDLTRSNSGLCRLHILTPAEAVIIRTERPLRDDHNRWPLTWRDGVVARERLAQTSALPAEATESASDRASYGLEHCGTHADGQEVPEVANAGEWALVWIAAVAGGVAFLLSPLGQAMLDAIGGGK